MRLFPIILIFCVLLSGTTAFARETPATFSEAIQFFQNQNYSASRDLLRKLVKTEPGKALYWFNLGNAHYMLGDFRNAEYSFRKVETLRSPLGPAARLYRAKALRSRKRVAEARNLLAALAKETTLPSNLKASVMEELATLDDDSGAPKQAALADYQAGRYLAALEKVEAIKNPDGDVLLLKGLLFTKLNRIEEAAALADRASPGDDSDRMALLRTVIARLREEVPGHRPFWLLLESAVGYDSNIYLESQGSDPQAAAALKMGAAVGGRYWMNGPWHAHASYRFDWSEFSNAGDLKTISHFAQTSLVREDNGDTLLAGVTAVRENWGNQPAVQKFGTRAHFRRSWSESDAGAECDLIKSAQLREELSYLGGTELRLRVFTGFAAGELYSQVFVEAQKNQTGNIVNTDGSVLPWSYDSWGPGVRASWHLAPSWSLFGQVLYRIRNYSATSQPGNLGREDRETQTLAHLSRILGPRLSSYLSVALVKNTSTLGSSSVRDENFSAQTAYIGIVYDLY